MFRKFNARDIVKGLLEFSRTKEFTRQPVALDALVERSVRLISGQVPAGVLISQDIPRDLVVFLDAQRIQEALLNLLMNAIQAIDPPPGKVSIAASVDAHTHSVVITVADTGKGIPAKAADRIFDPFFTTKDVGVGTGLGLSIVYGIIKQHNGSIRVEGRPGNGAQFIVRLPLE